MSSGPPALMILADDIYPLRCAHKVQTGSRSAPPAVKVELRYSRTAHSGTNRQWSELTVGSTAPVGVRCPAQPGCDRAELAEPENARFCRARCRQIRARVRRSRGGMLGSPAIMVGSCREAATSARSRRRRRRMEPGVGASSRASWRQMTSASSWHTAATTSYGWPRSPRPQRRLRLATVISSMRWRLPWRTEHGLCQPARSPGRTRRGRRRAGSTVFAPSLCILLWIASG